eukprot:211518_1
MSSKESAQEALTKYEKEKIITSICSLFDQNQISKLLEHIRASSISEDPNSQQDVTRKASGDPTDDCKTLNEEEEEEDDAILDANVEYMKKYGFRMSWQSIERSMLKEMIDSDKNDFVILDVRTKEFDHDGGHIVGSINIPADQFQNKIHKTVVKYCTYKTVVIHCMYSQMRGPHACDMYYNALQELCKNYRNKAKEPEFQYSLRKLKKIYEQMDDVKYEQLYNQNIYLLREGFNGWINECVKNTNDLQKYVDDYDGSKWELEDDQLVHKLDWNTSDMHIHIETDNSSSD